MFWKKAVGAAAALCAAQAAHSAVVYANNGAPGDNFTNATGANQGQAVGASGWYYNNVRNNGSAGIHTAFPRSGNASVRFEGTQGPGGASSKADIEYLAGGVNVGGNYFATASLGAFTSLSSMAYDWYRDPTSANDPGQHPSMRVLLDLDGNLGTLGDRGGLVFERAYNGGGAAPTGAWVSETIGAGTYLWNFGLGGSIDLDGNGYPYDSTLADWQASGRMANAVILGFSSGIGSGWGPFIGAVDNIGWTIGQVASSTNFEVQAAAVPEPASLGLVGLALATLAVARRRKPAPRVR